MDFSQLAAAFDAEVIWTEGGKTREPLRFTIRGGDRPEIQAYPELVEGECVAVIFAVLCDAWKELPRIVLRREGALDRGGKALGINREVQLGDPVFDAAVYVESEAPAAAVQGVLAAAEARSAAAALITGVSDEVVLGEGRITAHVVAAELADPRAPKIQGALGELATLATAMAVPRDMPSRAELVRQRPIGPMIGIAFAWLVLMMLAVLLRPPVMLAWGPVWIAVGVGVLLWALTCGGLVLALRGGHDSLRWVIASAGFFLLVAPFAGMKGALALNAALDGAPEVTASYPVRLIDRSGGRVLVEVDGFAPGEASTRLDLPAEAIEGELPPALAQIRLTTRPGVFGWVWLVKARP